MGDLIDLAAMHARTAYRPRPPRLGFGVLFLLTALAPHAAGAGAWSGSVAAQLRLFPAAAPDPRQHGDNVSLSAEPQWRHEWDGGRQSFTFTPFVRLDRGDPERTHADVRELLWTKAAAQWELRLGIGKVFWGVAESQHLVDIVNQTDLVEDPDREEKLGQPMIDLTWIRPWGTLDFFLLPGFRERTFPGPKGRLRGALPVDTDRAVYGPGAGRRRTDRAVRWSHTLGDWDVGLYHFRGTGREPRLVPGRDRAGAAVLVPRYDRIDQWGLDVQATKGSWLWKLEAIRRSGRGGRFSAAVGGLEYTLYGVFGSAKDLGVLLEYHYDSRGRAAPTVFQDDLMLGLRLAFNDAQSTEALVGAIVDLDGGARLYSLEASRRLGHRYRLGIEARVFSGLPPSDPFFGLRRDDYVQVELAYYF